MNHSLLIDRQKIGMVEGIEGRCGRPFWLFKEREDNPSEGFQERNEVWEKAYLEELYRL